MNINFPQLPLNFAKWSPLIWHPVCGSEDALLVGIAGQIGESFFAERIIPDNVLSLLYRTKKLRAASIIDFTVDCLNKQNAQDISKLKLPISGFTLGEIVETYCDNKQDLLEQAIKLKSSLITYEEYTAWIKRQIFRSDKRKKFIKDVKQLVVNEHAELEKSFNVQKAINGFDIDYNFFSSQLVSQIGVLREKHLFNDSSNLRKFVLDLLDANDLWHPCKTLLLVQEDFYNKKLRGKTIDAFNAMARNRGIRFETVSQPTEGKEVLLDLGLVA